jgi:hypothetical protein
MVTLFNESLDIGSILNATTSNMTGSLTLTFLLVVVVLFLIAMLFREPVMLFGLFILPLIIVFAIGEGWGGLFYTILTVIGIILAWQFAKIIMGWGR